MSNTMALGTWALKSGEANKISNMKDNILQIEERSTRREVEALMRNKEADKNDPKWRPLTDRWAFYKKEMAKRGLSPLS